MLWQSLWWADRGASEREAKRVRSDRGENEERGQIEYNHMAQHVYLCTTVYWWSARVMPVQWMWKGVMDSQTSRQTDTRDAEGDCEGNDGYGFQSRRQVMRQATNAELQWITNRHGSHLTVMACLWGSTYWTASHFYSAVRQAAYYLLPVCLWPSLHFLLHLHCLSIIQLSYV